MDQIEPRPHRVLRRAWFSHPGQTDILELTKSTHHPLATPDPRPPTPDPAPLFTQTGIDNPTAKLAPTPPLLANVALSLLDEHFDQHWRQKMGTDKQRRQRGNKGLGNWRLVRYCDDFALMVFGERQHAEALREEVSAVLAPMGLWLAPEKTQVVHIADEDFTFLGLDIRRMRKRGTGKHYVYTKPSRKAIQSIKDKVRAKTYRGHNPLPGPGRAHRRCQQIPGGMGELLPARGVQGDLQRGRLLRMGSARAMDTRQVRGQNRAVHEGTPPSTVTYGSVRARG